MAGMLPGVEAARRRRVHQSMGCSSSSSSSSRRRRYCYSLFSPNTSSASASASASAAASLSPRSWRRSWTYHNQDDEKLGASAREAKDRLDVKLRAPHLFTRNCDNLNEEMRNCERLRGITTQVVHQHQHQHQRAGSSNNRGGKSRLTGGLGWKSGEQQECAVCLDEFQVRDNLVILPCAHTFHSSCLLPWLHSNAYCPCCRIYVHSS